MFHNNFCNSIHFRDEQKIEFRDVNDFNKILLSHSVAPHKPEILTTIGASTLIYGHGSKKLIEVRWLDLSESKPKLAAGKSVILTQLGKMFDICFVEDGDKQLLVVAAFEAGLFAYNIKMGKLEWKVNGKVSGMEQALDAGGVTSDEHSYLLVADSGNECIQMFSASDGQYLGFLMTGVETIGDPIRVHWSPETSSLLTACSLQDTFSSHLQFINIQHL